MPGPPPPPNGPARPLESTRQDEFNLSGLSSHVPYYDYALDLILDVESPNDEILTEEQHETIEGAAEVLYGLIHQRYILTTRGLAAMMEKYCAVEFGRCPRVFCSGMPVLPVGQSDVARTGTVKVFCPKCRDVYFPWNKYQGNVDGAYFGTTFPHLFMMTYGNVQPAPPTQSYVPRVFGFRVSEKAYEHRPGRKSSRTRSKDKGFAEGGGHRKPGSLPGPTRAHPGS